MGGVQHGGLSIKNADGSTPDTYSETIQMWTDGIQEIFSSASFINSKILYVQQVPTSKPTSPTLIRKTSSNSTSDLSFSSNRNEIVQAEEQALSGFNDVTLFNPADYLCPNNRCSASKDENSIYSDENHLSPYGAQMLAPSIGQVIKQLLNI
jgi:protein-disulfide isomerase